jgi:hypothetical protein
VPSAQPGFYEIDKRDKSFAKVLTRVGDRNAEGARSVAKQQQAQRADHTDEEVASLKDAAKAAIGLAREVVVVYDDEEDEAKAKMPPPAPRLVTARTTPVTGKYATPHNQPVRNATMLSPAHAEVILWAVGVLDDMQDDELYTESDCMKFVTLQRNLHKNNSSAIFQAESLKRKYGGTPEGIDKAKQRLARFAKLDPEP